MKAFLHVSCPIAVWIITALEALFVFLAFRGWKRSKEALYLLTALIALGLFYDALILSLRTLMQGGPALSAPSRMCFLLYARRKASQ